jgi:hypothetical protein
MAAASLAVRLSAQISEFQKAFEDATRTTDKFKGTFGGAASEVAKHQQRLNAAFESFSGDNIIRSANELTQAITKVGGASKLTEAEQRRANSTLQEAIAKYQVLGQAAPRALTDLEQATRRMAAAVEANRRPVSLFGESIQNLEGRSTASGRAMDLLTGTFGKFTAAGLAVNIISKLTGELAAFVDRGTKLGPVQTSFTKLAESVGQDSQTMLASMQTATQGLVSNYDLMLSANKAVLLGLPVTSGEMGNLAKTATALGRAMGLDATTALNDLIVALGRSSPLILDNLGLTVKVGEANESYARSLGKSVEALSDSEKKMAFYLAAMDKAREKVAQLGEQHLTFGQHIGRVWTSVGNVVSTTVSFINTEIGRLISETGNAISKTGSFLSSVASNGFRATLGMNALNGAMADYTRHASKAATLPAVISKTSVQLVQEMERAVAKLTVAQREEIKAAQILGGDALKRVLEQYKLTETHLRILDVAKKDAIRTDKEISKNALEMVRRIEEENAARDKLQLWIGKNTEALRKLGLEAAIEQHAILTRELNAQTQAWVDLEAAMRAAAKVTPLTQLPGIATSNLKSAGQVVVPETFWTSVFGSGAEFGSALSKVIQGALQGGGKVGESAGALLGGELLGGIAKKLTTDGGKHITGALGGIISASFPVLGALMGQLGGKLLDKLLSAFDQNKGRDLVKTFADTFGGFDALQAKLVVLGEAGEQLWIALTQGKAENSPEAARAAIEAVNAALDAAGEKEKELAETVKEAEATKERARSAGLAMLRETLGGSEAKALADAFQKAQLEGFKGGQDDFFAQQLEFYGKLKEGDERLKTWFSSTTINAFKLMEAGQTDAFISLTGKLRDLGQEYDRLYQSIASEAPEEVMGVIEQQTRERMAAIAAERTATEHELDKATKEAAAGFADVTGAAEESARDIEQAFENVTIKPIKVPFDFSGMHGGGFEVPELAHGGIVRKPTLALIGEAGPEAVVPLSRGGGSNLSGFGDTYMTTQVVLDGRVIQESTEKVTKRMAATGRLRTRVAAGRTY